MVLTLSCTRCRQAYPNNTGLVSGIKYRDITMHSVGNPILVTGRYCPPSQRPWPCPLGKQAVDFHDISFTNIKGTGKALDGIVGNFDCDPASPCYNISLSDINLTLAVHGEPRFRCTNVSGAVSDDVFPSSCFSPGI